PLYWILGIIIATMFVVKDIKDKKITILLEMKLSLLVVFQILKNNDPKTLLFLRELIEMITIKQ
ncbi:MAG: hypothetical protein U9R32_06570, partial [Bacteroidota bacterium]|nr:hypothetical protein [Bacteroidota bacterium]